MPGPLAMSLLSKGRNGLYHIEQADSKSQVAEKINAAAVCYDPLDQLLLSVTAKHVKQ